MSAHTCAVCNLSLQWQYRVHTSEGPAHLECAYLRARRGQQLLSQQRTLTRLEVVMAVLAVALGLVVSAAVTAAAGALLSWLQGL